MLRGNDKVYIVPETIDVEKDRKLPILLAKDIASGKIDYGGLILLNPFDEDGTLIKFVKISQVKKIF